MSDVFDEIISRLKQKAKSYLQITLEIAKEVDVAKAEEGKEPKVKKPKWVRLKDVETAIQQLKQNIVDEIIELIHRLEREIGLMVVDGLGADITDSFIQNLKEELLRENEEG